MRAVLQRVLEASVSVHEKTISHIGPGILVFLGVMRGDTEVQANWLASKVLNARIFADNEKAMNRSVIEMDGELLVVSQFTLAGDLQRGNRPNFSAAENPSKAEHLYHHFVDALASQYREVSTGEFGADMQVASVNDGPVTIFLDCE